MSEHNAMMYGNFGKKVATRDELEELKATKLQLLKKIYLPKQACESISSRYIIIDPFHR